MDIGLSLGQNKHMASSVDGFSKWTKSEKIKWVVDTYASDPQAVTSLLEAYWHPDPQTQQLHDEFIENTISNFYMPFGVAPNFLINNNMYAIPMAIEESSVVAAASKSANFWLDRGGFKTEVIGMVKVGHVHFLWEGTDVDWLTELFESNKHLFYAHTDDITKNMRIRGGGIQEI